MLQSFSSPSNLSSSMHYRVEEGSEIGRGAFSRVYKAIDPSGRVVAIKQLKLHLIAHELRDIAKRCLYREATLLAQLRHPQIPCLYGYSWEDGYLALEYIPGITLAQHLHSYRVVSFQQTLHIGLQLCNVLMYLHAHQPPIIFRDLKPQNIILQANGGLTLIDFGLAWPEEYESCNLGTPGYAAPEQYATPDESGAACVASDIYSLGALLHRIISTEEPARILTAGRINFAPLQERTDPRLANLIMSMLHVHPAYRPTIQMVQQQLQVIQQVPLTYEHL